MTTRFRFPDESTAIAALAQYRLAGKWWTGSHTHALDVIGTMYSDPVSDDAGEIVTPAEPLEGWHVNLIGDVPVTAEPYIIEPTTPRKVFAALEGGA